ncbi:MAG: undecaprenyl-diphosphate phosphatase [Clostridiales bacterium]|nr:undecaprenyl-diphosphate phosphatase [Clostridiales bacterium]
MEFLEILKIILLGIVEGITEWLPVSSTGHMILLNHFLPLTNVSEAFIDMFEYVIQLAAILAVVVIFWKRIFPIDIKTNTLNENGVSKKLQLGWKKDILSMWLKVVIACIPAVLALAIDTLFSKLSPTTETAIISATLILYGVAFLLVETFNKSEPKIKEISQLSYRYAFFIGCIQVLAAVPGTSRSGITILGALLLGVSRTAAAEFTFFLAIPTMVGSSAYKLLKFFLDRNVMSAPEIGYLIIGSLVAFALSLFAVKFLMNFVKKHDFKVFGWYRIGLGAIVLLTLLFL